MRVSAGMFLTWCALLVFSGVAFGVGGVVTVVFIGALLTWAH